MIDTIIALNFLGEFITGLLKISYLCNNAILRYKKVIGPNMKAREIPQQKTEGGLNRMTSLGMPVSVKVK